MISVDVQYSSQEHGAESHQNHNNGEELFVTYKYVNWASLSLCDQKAAGSLSWKRLCKSDMIYCG